MALKDELTKQGHFLFRYRSFIPILFIPFGIYLFYKNINSGQGVFHTSYAYWCLAIGLFGLWIRVLAVGHSPANTSGRNTKEGQVADTVNTTGIYSLMRHPLYVGNYFMFLALAMLSCNIWFGIIFSLLYFIYYERIIYTEEDFLTNKFGSRYTDWARVTPAILPRSLSMNNADYAFSWKKVFKKEKNGFAALFVLFYLFYVLERYIVDRKFHTEINFWSIMAAFSLVLYGILKYMKYNTTLLNENDEERRKK
jgi:protein-S-isoprenylcysteine O-methyltransferase Ste14